MKVHVFVMSDIRPNIMHLLFMFLLLIKYSLALSFNHTITLIIFDKINHGY